MLGRRSLGNAVANLLGLTVFSLIFFSGLVSARAAGELVVNGQVPLSPEMAFSIGKNSTIQVADKSLRAGDVLPITVAVQGPFDQPVANRVITLTLSVAGQPVAVETTQSNSDGQALANVSIPQSVLGAAELQAVDVTNSEKVALKAVISLWVLPPIFSQFQAKLRGSETDSGSLKVPDQNRLLIWSPEGIINRDDLSQSYSLLQSGSDCLRYSGRVRDGPSPGLFSC